MWFYEAKPATPPTMIKIIMILKCRLCSVCRLYLFINNNIFSLYMAEPVTISMIVLTSILVFERLVKFYLERVKKSKCMGSEIEFRSNESIKRITETTI